MPEVLVGHGYYLRLDPKPWAAAQPYPPLGTLYAAAVLRERGHAVALFDAMLAVSPDEWQAALVRHRPALAVIHEDGFNFLTKMCLGRMRQATFSMIAAARRAGARVVASGPDATDDPQAYLDAGADFVVVGEGEITLAELADTLAGRSALRAEAIPGLCLRGPDGQVVGTPPRVPLTDPDLLPRPAWDLVDVEAYRRVWRARHGYHSLNLVSTRGCPYHCNWCAKPIWGQRYAVRRPEAVADEMRWLKDTYAPDHLWFCDDIFGLRPGWVERFADAVVERGAALPFKCLSRADLVGEDVARGLARAGCRTVWLGAESGSQRILDAMEKGITVDEIRGATARLRGAGIEVGFFLQFGYPGEEWDDIERTLALVAECAPDDIGVSVAYPLPGTRFHERVSSQLGAKRHWDASDELAMMFDGAFATPFYRRLHRFAHTRFRWERLRRRGLRGMTLRRVAGALLGAASLPWQKAALQRLSGGRARAALRGPVLSRAAAARPSDPAC